MACGCCGGGTPAPAYQDLQGTLNAQAQASVQKKDRTWWWLAAVGFGVYWAFKHHYLTWK